MLEHPFLPYYNNDSEILILGSFPSVKSREIGFYYGHPKNRFWQVLSLVFEDKIGNSIESKKEFLKRNKIALFDVCKVCKIKASSDASIKDVVPNDLEVILKNSAIKKIYLNGKTAYNLYNKFFKDSISIPYMGLPSTSPANAKFRLNDLVSAYKVLSKEEKC